LTHPGVNVLGRFLPDHKINDLLLAEAVRTRTSIDVTMLDSEGTTEAAEDGDGYDIMDLASFLEYVKSYPYFCYSHFARFAIQATHCLEVLNKCVLQCIVISVLLTVHAQSDTELFIVKVIYNYRYPINQFLMPRRSPRKCLPPQRAHRCCSLCPFWQPRNFA
jgi:hypothetical protein